MPVTRLIPTRLLRVALLGDAAASGATGLLLAAGGGLLAAPLGLPEPLLRGAGLLLLPYAAGVAAAGLSAAPPRPAVAAIIALNLLWGLDSLLLAAGLLGPTPGGLGILFVLAQGLAVLGFAGLQALALRRAAPDLAAA